ARRAWRPWRAPPQSCRHNRVIQKCPIGREPEPPPAPRRSRPRSTRAGSPAGSAATVRRAPRAVEDGYGAALVPGLHAGADARRLADELGIAAGRLAELATAPPGPYAEVAV